MSEQPQNAQQAPQEPQLNNKELNFRQLEAKYQRQLEQERQGRLEAERIAQEAQQRRHSSDDEDDKDDEPYVDKKKLRKEQERFGQKIKQETHGEIQKAVQHAIQEERKNNWIKNNPDFYDILQHAEKFAQKDPDLAESILEMPDNFERQKLVYKNIKALGIHKPEEKTPSIQDKVDANRRGPYYQPSSVGSAPYAPQGDFSPGGQKQAYEKLKQLKAKYGM